MARKTIDRVRTWHRNNTDPSECYRSGETWVELSNLTPEQALKLGTNALAATTALVIDHLGIDEEALTGAGDTERILAAALTTAALPFTRRRSGHKMDTLSGEALDGLLLVTSVDESARVRRLQDLGIEFEKSLRRPGINIYDLRMFPSPDVILETVLPAALGKLR